MSNFMYLSHFFSANLALCVIAPRFMYFHLTKVIYFISLAHNKKPNKYKYCPILAFFFDLLPSSLPFSFSIIIFSAIRHHLMPAHVFSHLFVLPCHPFFLLAAHPWQIFRQNFS